MDGPEDVRPPAIWKVYSVPRRYDLATLFVVSLAFAMLFAIIRAAGSPPVLFAVIAGYVTLIGASQAVLFRGRFPRLSSVIAGTLFVLGAATVFAVMEGDTWHLVALANPCTLVFGAFVAYLVGALIGGVFLVAEGCRALMRRVLKSRGGDEL